MKRFLTFFLLPIALPVFGQSWDIGIGLSQSYLERYGPYSGPESTLNPALILGYTTSLHSSLPARHQIRLAAEGAPSKKDQILNYGYVGLAAHYLRSTESGRFSWMAGLSLRRESYRLSGYRVFLPPDYTNSTLLTPDVDGSMIRPFLEAGFSYMGALVPFRQEGRTQLHTRLLWKKVISTPGASGWEDSLRQNLNQDPGFSIQVAVRFNQR